MKKFIKNNFIYIIIVLLCVSLNYIHLPYYIDTPGGTIDISDRIELENGKNKVNGSLNLLYVSEYNATIPLYLFSLLKKDWDIENISESQISDESSKDIYNRNKIMLENSINNAIYVAYTKANCNISIKDYKNIVIATTISNNLKIGDEILEIDGKVISNADVLRSIISNSDKGDVLRVKILRNNREKEINVKVYEEDGNKILGVMVITNYELEKEPNINIKFKSSEAGSSGGLMMALSIYNAISEEDIIKGRNIAGTGTINMDGKVGEISGIKYKIIGAYKNNIDVVLVPKANYDDAMKVKKEKGYDMQIVSVDTFDDAIKYLRSTK